MLRSVRVVLGIALLCSPACGRHHETDDAGPKGHDAGDDGHGSDDSGSQLEGSAAAQGSVTVVANDDASAQPISGAMVSVDGGAPQAITATLTLPTGRATLVVTATGHLPWQREVEVSNQPSSVVATLLALPNAGMVGANGETVGGGDFSVTFPPNAVQNGTTFAAVKDDGADVPLVVPRLQFEDSDAVVHRVVSLVSFKVSMTATQPVSITMPLPAFGTGAGVTIWTLADDGEWGSPMAPTAVTATNVVYGVTDTGTYAATVDVAVAASTGEPPLPVVLAASPGTMIGTSGTSMVPLTIAQAVPDGSTIVAGSGGVSIVDRHGGTISLAKDTTAVFTTCIDPLACAPGSTEIALTGGGVDYLSDALFFGPDNVSELNVLTTTTVAACRATVSAITDTACGTGRDVDNIEVYEGEVDIDPAAASLAKTDVMTSQNLAVCSNCPTGSVPSCNTP